MGEDDCVGQTEFNSFIEDFEVSAYVINEKINYEEYGEKPVFKLQTLLGSWLLKTYLNSETINNNIFLRQNVIETFDSLFNSISDPSQNGFFADVSQ